jgi:hypothetical protein
LAPRVAISSEIEAMYVRFVRRLLARKSVLLPSLLLIFTTTIGRAQSQDSASLPEAPAVQRGAVQAAETGPPKFAGNGDSPAETQAENQGPRNPANPNVEPEAALQTPESGDLWRRKYFLGDWDGVRTRLESRGISFDVFYMDDALGNARGGRADFGVWGRIRASMDVDFSKFTPDKDLTFHATGLWQYGVDLSKQYTFTAVDSSNLPSATQRDWIPGSSRNIFSTISLQYAEGRSQPTTRMEIPNMERHSSTLL